jgi:hypothetical protein
MVMAALPDGPVKLLLDRLLQAAMVIAADQIDFPFACSIPREKFKKEISSLYICIMDNGGAAIQQKDERKRSTS